MNLPPTATRVLACLKAKAKRGLADIRQRDIIIEANVSYGAMYSALRRLEEIGVIEIIRDLDDRREVRYRLRKIGD